MFIVVGLGVAAAGVGVWLEGRSGGDVVPDVRSKVIEQTTTTELPPTASAPTTVTSETTAPEPTVP